MNAGGALLVSKGDRLGYWGTIFIIYLSVLILCFEIWTISYFGQEVRLEEILYYANFGSQLASQVDSNLVISFVVLVITIPLVLGIIVFFAFRWGYKNFRNSRVFKFQKLSVFTIGTSVFALMLFIGILIQSSIHFRVNDWINSHFYNEVIDTFYRQPNVVASSDYKPNLIMIYAESLDTYWVGRQSHDGNLLLDETQGWNTFSTLNGEVGNHTIAGLVASQCGVPLKLPGDTNVPKLNGNYNLATEKIDEFLPNATCLGDVLKRQGYLNVFSGGANADFAGKGNFLKSHGFDEVYDESYWRSIGETSFSEWGLYDERLFENAKKQLLELQNSGSLFNFTLLTLDTHNTGLPSPGCKSVDEMNFDLTVQCETNMLGSFISWVKDQGFLENTAVVIIADHVHPGTVDKSTSLFNRFYSPIKVEQNTSDISTLDIFPTTSRLLGINFAGGKAALGVSGFGSADYATPTIRSISEYLDLINFKSKLIDSLW